MLLRQARLESNLIRRQTYIRKKLYQISHSATAMIILSKLPPLPSLHVFAYCNLPNQTFQYDVLQGLTIAKPRSHSAKCVYATGLGNRERIVHQKKMYGRQRGSRNHLCWISGICTGADMLGVLSLIFRPTLFLLAVVLTGTL